MSLLCMVLAKKLWDETRGRQYKMVNVNAGTRGLFNTTVLVCASGRVLATQPENHRCGGVIRQLICTSAPLQPSFPSTVHQPKRWILLRPVLLR